MYYMRGKKEGGEMKKLIAIMVLIFSGCLNAVEAVYTKSEIDSMWQNQKETNEAVFNLFELVTARIDSLELVKPDTIIIQPDTTIQDTVIVEPPVIPDSTIQDTLYFTRNKWGFSYADCPSGVYTIKDYNSNDPNIRASIDTIDTEILFPLSDPFLNNDYVYSDSVVFRATNRMTVEIDEIDSMKMWLNGEPILFDFDNSPFIDPVVDQPEPPIVKPDTATTGSVQVSWETNNQWLGYRVYYGTESGVYSSSFPAGNNYRLIIHDLEFDTYYFAVTGVDADGKESQFSEEVKFEVKRRD